MSFNVVMQLNGAERGLDFPQLDAAASALDLGIDPTEKVHEAVRPGSGDVAGLVQAVIGIGAPRVS
jgi:hypothetical protein